MRKLRLLVFTLVTGCAAAAPYVKVSPDLWDLINNVPGSYPATITPDSAATAYQRVLACSNISPHVTLERIRWRYVDSTSFSFMGYTGLAGWGNGLVNTITLATPDRENIVLIEHELGHVALGIVGHPTDPFQRCGWMAPIPVDTTRKP
jgi:hypothetical protein